VIGAEGEQLGIMSPEEGRRIAETSGLDLVEVAADARPPVCKILNYDKYRYEQSKKKAASKSDRVELKTIRLRPATDEHDRETKLKQVGKFLAKGNKVKLEMAMRGRERSYTYRWVQQLNEIASHLLTQAKIISPPRAEGRFISLVLEPLAVVVPVVAAPKPAAAPSPAAAPAAQ
jgi:translation initiation factor IF-3